MSSSRTPTVEWQVAGTCNYDCSYCTLARGARQGRPTSDQLKRVVAFFATLPGTWEIRCSGGEPFSHPLFVKQVVPGILQETAHRLSVLTNFSASNRDLSQFVEMTRGRLASFHASLHLEFAEAEAFAARAEWFAGQLDAETKFTVTQVVLPGLENEALRCRELFSARNIRWVPQQCKGKSAPDAPADAASRCGLELAPSFKGLTCWAGAEYLVVDKNGDLWPCEAAEVAESERLGNVFYESITLPSTARKCPYGFCPSPVPQSRGMVNGA